MHINLLIVKFDYTSTELNIKCYGTLVLYFLNTRPCLIHLSIRKTTRNIKKKRKKKGTKPTTFMLPKIASNVVDRIQVSGSKVFFIFLFQFLLEFNWCSFPGPYIQPTDSHSAIVYAFLGAPISKSITVLGRHGKFCWTKNTERTVFSRRY